MKKIRKTKQTSRQSLSSDGFTLVELLIAITMFSMVLVLISVTFIQINRSYTRGLSSKMVHEEARDVLESISSDMRTVSSSKQLIVECENGSSNCDWEESVDKLCIDNNVYTFIQPDASRGRSGSLNLAENTNCDGASRSTGSDMFSEQVQPYFFRVSEVVPDKTYKLELVLATGSYSSDLLQFAHGSGGNPRSLGCDVTSPGSQFCQTQYLDTTVTLRSDN